MLRKHTFILALLIGTTATWLHAADFKRATLFADHMVMQREKPVPVWGWAGAEGICHRWPRSTTETRHRPH